MPPRLYYQSSKGVPLESVAALAQLPQSLTVAMSILQAVYLVKCIATGD
jgi:hypothetical protein